MDFFYTRIILLIKRLLLLLPLLLFMPTVSAQQAFIGNWENRDSSSVVQIYEQGSQYYAKVLTSQDLESIGKVILVQMEKRSETKLFGGTYYDSELESEFEARMTLVNPNTIRVKVLTGIFTKTLLWHRVAADWEERTKLSPALSAH